MPRSTLAHVDLSAIERNYAAIARFVSWQSEAAGRAHPPAIIAVVKANAYGHGALAVARALERAGAPMLACADIEEGIVLRAGGVRAAILIFGALSVSDVGGLFENDLTPTLSTPGKLLVTFTMFIGRIGPLTLALAFARAVQPRTVEPPEERVMIG